MALSLKNQRTKTIGVIIPELIHYFFSSVIDGIEELAYEHGYTVMVCQSKESSEKEERDTMALLAHRVDGLLISQAKDVINYDHYQEVLDRGVPLIFFDRCPKLIDVTKVIIDDKQAAYDATQYLIQKGMKNILHLGNALHLGISKLRLEGYQEALRDHDIPIQPDLILEIDQDMRSDAMKSVRSFLQAGHPLDAIFASNDILAIGAMKAVKEHGLRVPEDVSIIGFSNWQFCDLVEPTLTSVDQPGIDMGKKAVELLLQEIKDGKPNDSQVITLDTKLVVRNSTK